MSDITTQKPDRDMIWVEKALWDKTRRERDEWQAHVAALRAALEELWPIFCAVCQGCGPGTFNLYPKVTALVKSTLAATAEQSLSTITEPLKSRIQELQLALDDQKKRTHTERRKFDRAVSEMGRGRDEAAAEALEFVRAERAKQELGAELDQEAK